MERKATGGVKRKRSSLDKTQASTKDGNDVEEDAPLFFSRPTKKIDTKPVLGKTDNQNREIQIQIKQDVKPTKNVSTTHGATADKGFEQFDLPPWLVQNCHDLNLHTPTPVQLKSIPAILSDANILASAKTGSGKTAAFALPMLSILSQDPISIFAVVLTPARELAFQISEQFSTLGRTIPYLKILTVTGGVPRMQQLLQLKKRPHIIVGTPGRVLDLFRSCEGDYNIRALRFLVLDEADRLVSERFVEILSEIMNYLPSTRQTLLYSATMTANLEHLAQNSDSQNAGRKFIRLDDGGAEAFHAKYELPDTLDQYYVFIPHKVKECYLVYILNQFFASRKSNSAPKERDDSSLAESEATAGQQLAKRKRKKPASDFPLKSRNISTVIVFAATVMQTIVLSRILRALDYPVTTLHSRLSQEIRNKNLHEFKQGNSKILLTTDVASRGLDIPNVSLVINFDLPSNSIDYKHRVGRTARAGRRGDSVSLVTQYDVERVVSIEEDVGKKMVELKTNEEDALVFLNETTTAKRIVMISLETKGVVQQEVELREKNRKAKREARERIGKQLGDSTRINLLK